MGRSPAVWIVGNSSASMPFTWVANRPQRRWSVSAPWSSRSTFSEPGRRADEVGQQPGGHGGRAVGLDLARHPVRDPDLEVGRRELEAGVLGPEEDVGEHGQGAPAGDRPRHHREAAGQVLLHDREFHVGCLQHAVWAGVARAASVDRASRCDGEGPASASWPGRWNDQPIFSSRHHRHNAVDTVDGDARSCGRRRWTTRRGPWMRRRRIGGCDTGSSVDGRGPRAPTSSTRAAGNGRFVPDAVPEFTAPPSTLEARLSPGCPPIRPQSSRRRTRLPRRRESPRSAATARGRDRHATGWHGMRRGMAGVWRRRRERADERGRPATRCRSAPGRPRPRGASRR